jgi:hypothetical protein
MGFTVEEDPIDRRAFSIAAAFASAFYSDAASGGRYDTSYYCIQ